LEVTLFQGRFFYILQVLEMYSSGGDLHLELPSGETEGPQTLWQIPPYQTKSVMKANFVARMENNHTAYIRYYFFFLFLFHFFLHNFSKLVGQIEDSRFFYVH